MHRRTMEELDNAENHNQEEVQIGGHFCNGHMEDHEEESFKKKWQVALALLPLKVLLLIIDPP